ncbi:unnamed protein product [Caenorhabditis angaria]|uniref:Uncharacterized protein n=1 Tax=Caenorhabditis angaria TaxID=860376 RepID=A0A9P1IZX3_9PELO|nr:unnamed protein product [Caenorhabditis angaria]
MFDRVLSEVNRKRVASEAVSTQQFNEKLGMFSAIGQESANQKKLKMTPSQKVCLKCMAGESGHITHILSSISK